jgi:hypothetical protein
MTANALQAEAPRAAHIPGPRDAALIAAITTFVMAAAGMFANLTLIGLLTGGADGAAERITDRQVLLGLAIVGFILVAVLDVVLAWAILRYFGDRHRGLPRLAGWLRVAYAAVLATAVGQLATALRLATGSGQADAAAHSALLEFSATWQLGLVVFAAHLVVLGTILMRDAATPTWLGVVIVVAAFAYAADGIARIFLALDSPVLASLTGLVAVSSIVGEIGLAIWFIARGGRVR